LGASRIAGSAVVWIGVGIDASAVALSAAGPHLAAGTATAQRIGVVTDAVSISDRTHDTAVTAVVWIGVGVLAHPTALGVVELANANPEFTLAVL